MMSEVVVQTVLATIIQKDRCSSATSNQTHQNALAGIQANSQIHGPFDRRLPHGSLYDAISMPVGAHSATSGLSLEFAGHKPAFASNDTGACSASGKREPPHRQITVATPPISSRPSPPNRLPELGLREA